MAAAPHPPHVSLKRFAGKPNENWDQFEGLIRASIAVSRIPEADNQRARYLHLHLEGNALNYYLRLAENIRNDLDDSLEALRNRYSGPDQRRNYELDLQTRKFDPLKEQPDDFLTDLQRLANLAIVDDAGAGINRADERTRRVRERFIQGMPFKYKKVLLRELDNVAVADLCSIVKRRLRIDQMNPESAHKTAFNLLTENSNPALTQAIENIMTAGIASLQTGAPNPPPERNRNPYSRQNYPQNNTFNRRPTSFNSYQPQYNRQSQNYRGNYRSPNPGSFNRNMTFQPRGRGRPNFARGRGFSSNFRGQSRDIRDRSPTPSKTFCRTCASNYHTAQDCPQRQPAYRNASMPFNQQPKN